MGPWTFAWMWCRHFFPCRASGPKWGLYQARTQVWSLEWTLSRALLWALLWTPSLDVSWDLSWVASHHAINSAWRFGIYLKDFTWLAIALVLFSLSLLQEFPRSHSRHFQEFLSYFNRCPRNFAGHSVIHSQTFHKIEGCLSLLSQSPRNLGNCCPCSRSLSGIYAISTLFLKNFQGISTFFWRCFDMHLDATFLLTVRSFLLTVELFYLQLSGTFRWPQPPVFSQKYCRTNGRRTAVQMGGVLQYKWEVYWWVSLSSRLRSQERPAIQMGGVLPYKLEVYCRTFFETSRGWGFRNSSEIDNFRFFTFNWSLYTYNFSFFYIKECIEAQL